MQAPKIYSTAVDPAWIDYNGHLRDGYYGVIMSLACDALMDLSNCKPVEHVVDGGATVVVQAGAAGMSPTSQSNVRPMPSSKPTRGS